MTKDGENGAGSSIGPSGVFSSVRGQGGEIAGVMVLVREQWSGGEELGGVGRGGGARFTAMEDLSIGEGILQALSLSIDTV